MAHDGNIAFTWCAEFISELYHNGLEQAVISPGSRSTPLTLALALHGGIRTHVILDERSASFMAVGIGKATGRPAVLVCTSGTAAANYYPAVIEARRSGTPLIVLTADRPPLLRNIGASQAMDQLKLYGDYPVLFFETGEPTGRTPDLERLRILACQAWQESRSKHGPVHINFPFRKPLEPEKAFLKNLSRSNKRPERKTPKITKLESSVRHTLPEILLTLMDKSRKPLVIDGPRSSWSAPSDAAVLSTRWQAPLISEATANTSYEPDWLITGFDSFLRNKKIQNRLRPDLIIRFGYQPVSKGLELFLEACRGIPQIHIGGMAEWQDPVRSNTHRFYVNDSDRIDWNGFKGTIDEKWAQAWRHYSDNHKARLADLFKNDSHITDGRIYYELIPEIPENWQIYLSNSFPVRDFDLFRAADHVPQPVLCNRGVSGIDGITSSAIGAVAGSGMNGVLFTGDLAFYHDINGLMAGKELNDKQSLIIIVINNNGGNIFKMLPIAGYPEIFDPYFVTPQDISIKQLSDAYHLGYQEVTDLKELKKIFNSFKNQNGLHVLECITDTDRSMEQRHALWDR